MYLSFTKLIVTITLVWVFKLTISSYRHIQMDFNGERPPMVNTTAEGQDR